MTGDSIDKSVGSRFIKILVVYAHLPFTVRFLDHHDVGQPSRVVCFSDEPDF